MNRSLPGRGFTGPPRGTLSAARRRVRRGGFSLIELMVAITILGLGLVMVATMFPVAWNRARTLSEVTTESTVIDTAEFTLKLLTKADGPDTMAGSFAGDLLVYDGERIATPDNLVHALYLENVLASTPGAYTPGWEPPEEEEDWKTAPWWLERMEPRLLPIAVLLANYPEFFETGFGGMQVRFGQRWYPPLPSRDPDTIDDDGKFKSHDRQWEDTLDTRRYAWAALHRLREPEFNLDNPLEDEVAKPRAFDVYYVALKRSRPTYRFAQQDPDEDKVPDPWNDRETVPVPAALPPEYDVVLPVPWRVQVYFPETLVLGDEDDPATGVPTEIEVNTSNVPTAPFVVDFFQPGTPFIDERNGEVFRVVKRRLAGDDENEAYLTLDREVLVGDIDDGYNDGLTIMHGGDGTNVGEEEELIRTVWVFPPPVEATRLRNDEPVFIGKQPVLNIEVRRMNFEPGRP